VHRHRIVRPHGDPGHVIIDLEFDDLDGAAAMVTSLRALWNVVEGKEISVRRRFLG
jgi:hypothetical protein